MPVYLPPNFNVLCSVWIPPALPSTSLASYTQLLQVYVYSRTPQQMLHPASGRWLPVIILREPFAAGTHLAIDYIVSHTTPPGVATPYYKVQYAQRLHVGFTNEYFAYISLQCNANGTIPRTPLPT